jgi:hypothetical protein
MNEDEGRIEQTASYRIKLFKETSRQASPRSADPATTTSPREEWDRRQSIREAGRALLREADTSLTS